MSPGVDDIASVPAEAVVGSGNEPRVEPIARKRRSGWHEGHACSARQPLCRGNEASLGKAAVIRFSARRLKAVPALITFVAAFAGLPRDRNDGELGNKCLLERVACEAVDCQSSQVRRVPERVCERVRGCITPVEVEANDRRLVVAAPGPAGADCMERSFRSARPSDLRS